MSVTRQAAGHVGTDYTQNLRSARNQSKKPLRQLFLVTPKLITDRTDIFGITTIIGNSSFGERERRPC